MLKIMQPGSTRAKGPPTLFSFCQAEFLMENHIHSNPHCYRKGRQANSSDDSEKRISHCIAVWSVTQSYLTLWSPMDCSLPGSSCHGILQARILEWVTISFSRESSQSRDRTQVLHIAGRCFNLWATKGIFFFFFGFSSRRSCRS